LIFAIILNWLPVSFLDKEQLPPDLFALRPHPVLPKKRILLFLSVILSSQSSSTHAN
jgi:hypothetical protein